LLQDRTGNPDNEEAAMVGSTLPLDRTNAGLIPGFESGNLGLKQNSKSELDRRLDRALEETFPASDPVSVVIAHVHPGNKTATDQDEFANLFSANETGLGAGPYSFGFVSPWLPS
jgi:hypothetical protein